MILYSLPISNYCGKVLHALRFKDLECEILPPPGGYGSEEYKKRVPSGTIPALDHDGVILSESEVINEYLNEVFPEPNLLPGSAEQRAKIRMLCRLHDLKARADCAVLVPGDESGKERCRNGGKAVGGNGAIPGTIAWVDPNRTIPGRQGSKSGRLCLLPNPDAGRNDVEGTRG